MALKSNKFSKESRSLIQNKDFDTIMSCLGEMATKKGNDFQSVYMAKTGEA